MGGEDDQNIQKISTLPSSLHQISPLSQTYRKQIAKWENLMSRIVN